MSAVPAQQALLHQPWMPDGRSVPDLPAQGVRDLASVAGLICEVPFACISLADGDIMWVRPDRSADASTRPSHQRFNEQTLRGVGIFEVTDAAADPRFPSATGFYAGVPLVLPDGETLGTLAVMDDAPRRLSEAQRHALIALAANVTAQLSLCAELQFFREVADSAPVAIYRTGAHGEITYRNSEYCKVFGLARDQSTDDWPDHVHPDDRAQLQADWADFCRQPRAINLEYRTQPPGAALRHFTERCVPIEGAASFVGTITDVTERVAARRELHKTETLFQNTCEQAPIGIAYADVNGRLLRCNQAFTELLGFGPEELEYWTLRELTYGEDRATAVADLARLWRGEVEFVDAEKRYRRKDGTVLWVRTSTALVREGTAPPECSVEFLRDISVRKAMQADLVQNQSLLEAIVTNMPVSLLTSDALGNITRYNRAAEELFGIQADTVTPPRAHHGYPLTSKVFLPDGVTPVVPEERPLARALRGETISDLELVVVPTGAAPRRTLTNARRLVDPNGQTLGAVSVIQDITERKQAELELERVHQQLVDASRQAGMAEIATNVLHNVGNVLNSVNVSASLLADRLKQTKTAGLVQVAALLKERAADLAAFITDDPRGRQLPTYLTRLAEQLQADQRTALEELASLRNNIEHIKHTVTMQQTYARRCGVAESVALAPLVDDCVRMNIGALTRHGVAIVRDIDNIPPIIVDRHKLLQILVNLVRNAKNACEESTRTDKTVTIRVAAHEDRVRISVMDNGIGIPAENMDRLFTHGFTTRASGHGFGLHSGALAARELGGTLSAFSDGPGLGATFVLELPQSAAGG